MEYRILEIVFRNQTLTKYKVIGDGFKSLNPMWLSVYMEINRRMLKPPVAINFVFERLELDGSATIIGELNMDDRSLPLDPDLSMPI